MRKGNGQRSSRLTARGASRYRGDVKDLPLRVRTPDSWAETALQDPLQLLSDHAHLERKAALNAIDLLLLWPGLKPPKQWVRVLTAVAKDEVAHLAKVARILERRGGEISRAHRSGYAHDLRGLVRMGRGPDEILDRLLISALIELRSCERFEILGRKADDAELRRLYRALWTSEHGHYTVFTKLAFDCLKKQQATERWQQLLEREGEIIQQQRPSSTLHSWVE